MSSSEYLCLESECSFTKYVSLGHKYMYRISNEFSFHTMYYESKIEKVPRGIRGEKSSKDMASSGNLVSTIGALAIKSQNGGRNQVSGRVNELCVI